MSAASPALTEGTRVRVTTQSTSGDVELDRQAGRAGAEYDVYCWAAGSDGDDPNGKAYYLLDDEYTIGGSHWAYPEHVEVVMTVEQKAARDVPSVIEVRAEVASALIDMHRSIEAYETEFEGDDAVLVCGRTEDGLNVAFRVRIDRPWAIDE